MIQDATGKFSSRWVLPDRRSLAVLIGIVASVEPAAAGIAHAASRADPIYGKFAGKTNAISGFSRPRAAARRQSFRATRPRVRPECRNRVRSFGVRVRAWLDRNDDHCPWFVSTWLQGLVSFARFCCRHARMVKSP